MYTHNGRTIQVNRAWTSDDGYQHPKNWATSWKEQDLKKWSVVYSEDPVKKTWDNRFYWGYKVDSDGKETDQLNPKSLGDVEGTDSDGNKVVNIGLKTQYINSKKKEANDLLHRTDWYVIRKQEKGTAIPKEISDYRDAVRTACAGIETKIKNAATLGVFKTLFDKKGDGSNSDMDCYPEAVE